MSFSRINDPDAAEALEARAPEQGLDIISQALGSGVFVHNHRFGDLYIVTAMGRSPRLSVSRYYWNLEPPVAVDMARDLKFAETEVEAKQVYFAAQNIRYVLARDEWDEAAIRAAAPVTAEAEQAAERRQTQEPSITGAPRRKRTRRR